MTSPPPDLSDIAELCKSSGDGLRLEILRALKTGSYSVLELCEIFEVKQPSLSHHLKIMAKAYTVTTRREGNSIFYRRALANVDLPHGQLLQALYQAIDASPLAKGTEQRINGIKLQRSQLSRQFFNKHASQFQQQQELIAQYHQYADSAKELLHHSLPAANSYALEIGPGCGEFLRELSPLFEKVIALDISEEMLRQAETFASVEHLDNVEFMLGDTQVAIDSGLKVHHIACNMVLHHVPSPVDVFHDCSALLNDGGTLVISDLCRHEQHWTRESCGDSWLGFDPEELADWAQQAGLTHQESLYLGLRNGFQIQIQRFDKAAG